MKRVSKPKRARPAKPVRNQFLSSEQLLEMSNFCAAAVRRLDEYLNRPSLIRAMTSGIKR